MIWLAFLALPAVWVLANFAGWLSVQDIPGRPFSWRAVVGGPFLYYRWLDRAAVHQTEGKANG